MKKRTVVIALIATALSACFATAYASDISATAGSAANDMAPHAHKMGKHKHHHKCKKNKDGKACHHKKHGRHHEKAAHTPDTTTEAAH